MDRSRGVNGRGESIQIDFYYKAIRCRETLKLKPTKSNLKYAERLRSAILHEIEIGTFSYAKHFPNSKNATLGLNISTKTIAQALDDYIRLSKRELEHSTWKGYYSAVEFHLKPAFGNIRIVDLTASHVRNWIATLAISNKRISNVLIPLRHIMDEAFCEEVIDKNPMLRIKNQPNREKKETDPFTQAEIQLILKQLPPQGKNLIQFAVWTGLRTSELIALEWGDIDWNAKVVRVRRACVNKIIKQPKTKSGERDVTLIPPALEALIDQKQFTYLANQRVFHNPRTNEAWETDGQIRKTMWEHALRKAGVRYRTPYQTRHTFASTALSSGENPMWVAKQMGHKDWSMIIKVYGRYIKEVDTSAGKNLIGYWSQTSHKEAIND